MEAAGYNVATHGQKTFNGVAILAKRPFEVERGLPGDENDEQSRYIEAVIPTKRGALRLASLYLPNGNPAGTEKYAYKLAFMDRLIAHARKLLTYEEPLAIAGDYNVIPEPIDAAHPEQWVSDALFLPQTRAKFRELLALGFTDAFRACDGAAGRLHILGLSGGRLAKKQRHPHRPSIAVAASGRPACERDDRSRHARKGQGVGPRSDQDRAEGLSLAARRNMCANLPPLRGALATKPSRARCPWLLDCFAPLVYDGPSGSRLPQRQLT